MPLWSHWCASGTPISTKGRALTIVAPYYDTEVTTQSSGLCSRKERVCRLSMGETDGRHCF